MSYCFNTIVLKLDYNLTLSYSIDYILQKKKKFKLLYSFKDF